MINEVSSGAILFRRNNHTITFLILHYYSGHWDFPKGNKEEGESNLETALREIMEETGIRDVIILDKFMKQVFYKYKRNNHLVSKKVTYFLAETKSTNVVLSKEHLNYVWAQYDEAFQRITYSNSKEILTEGYKFLTTR